MSQANDDRILTVAKDGAEAKIPRSKPFARSFILHESDLLSILNSLINSTSNPNKTNDITMNGTSFNASTSNDNSNNNNDNNNNNNNDNNRDNLNTADKPDTLNGTGVNHYNTNNNDSNYGNKMPNANTDLVDIRWSKRIKKIISNPNLSANTKTELINDLFRTATTRKRLVLERRLPGGSRKLLGAGIVAASADAVKQPLSADLSSPSASNRDPPIKSEAVGSKANAEDNGADADVETEEDSDDASAFDRPDDEKSDSAGDTSDDTDDNDDDADVSDDDDDDDVDGAVDDIRTPYYWASDLLVTCANEGIALSKPARFRVMSVGKKLGRLFSIPVDGNKLESKDRRFYILKDGMVHYQYHTKEIRMPIYKLIASLTLPTSKLFRTLRTISFPTPVKKYSSYDKFLLAAIVDAAGITSGCIPCSKLREICSE